MLLSQEEAREYYAKNYIDIINRVINDKYYRFNNEIKEDLYSIGLVGLCKAINKFDKEKGDKTNKFNKDNGTKFETYAYKMVHKEMSRRLSKLLKGLSRAKNITNI